MSGFTSSPGIREPIVRANRPSCRRSARRASAAPGYCSLTATSRPSFSRPRCTWPIDAAAAGTSPNSSNRSRQRLPSSRLRIVSTVEAGIGGAESCSLVRVARYGAASSSGIADSIRLSICPNFIAPPLSSPRTANN